MAAAWQARQQVALEALPEGLRELPRTLVPLRGFDMVGLPARRALLEDAAPPVPVCGGEDQGVADLPGVQPLDALVDELARQPHALVMVMGKGGVGKTAHLSTADPAAHLAATLDGEVEGLRVDRIDPQAETQRYVDKVMASKGRGMDEAVRALLLEDLRSPCTEEVAVFHAFSRIVSDARSAFVILDTAPTGHTLLLMDATGAYHRQMLRDFEGSGTARVVTPLMRLQDPDYTRVLLVTLPETTPVSEAAALQEDLRRARIEPFAWIVNSSLAASGTTSPVLRARVAGGLAQRTCVVPWRPQPPIGVEALRELVEGEAGQPV